MTESFDAFRYVRYMRSRGLWIAGSCGVAVVLALAISLMLPREYTAVARMVIEPPAGTDLRSAMAVSPIYLESLRTYEHFATGDSLFQKAVDRFGLHSEAGRPIESLKRRILKVEIIRNTRIMEISATLPDARKAQALAQFLADATADLNRSLIAQGDQELLQSIERQAAEARAHLGELDAAWSHMLAAEPVRELASAQENAAMLRSDLEEQIVNADMQASEAAQSTTHSRAAELRRQVEILDRQTAEREKLLAARTADRDNLDAERRAAQTALTAIEGRLREVRSDVGYRGERLKIIDPGIVPERPSSPNVPLNLVAALLLGTVLPVLYFTLEMAWQEQRTSSRRAVFHE
jgi:capsule polysaccharide export protein KpsE/RkpR